MGHDYQDRVSLEIAGCISEGLPSHPEWVELARANLKRWREINRDAPLTEVFAAYLHDTPIAAGWIRHFGSVSYLFGGSTLAKYRGQGAYRALVARRHQSASVLGSRFLVSECSPESERILKSLGFQDAGRALQFECIRPPDARE